MCAYTGVRGRSTRAHGINVRAGVYACVRACANRYLLLLRNSFIIYSAAGDTPQDKPVCRGNYKPVCDVDWLYGDNGDIDEDLTCGDNGYLCGVLRWAEFGDWFYGYVENCHVGIIMDFNVDFYLTF